MGYVPKEKLKLHLKLGRELFQFIGLGEYFESKTFEYLALFKERNEYTVKLVQVLDYMYSFSPSLDEFETVEELENECESKFTGSLEDCLAWTEKTYKCTNDTWSLDVIETFLDYVENKVLGQGREYTE